MWSPSVHVDPAWKPVKDMIYKELGVDEQKEKVCFDSYKSEELEAVIDTQKRIVDAQKKRGTRSSTAFG